MQVFKSAICNLQSAISVALLSLALPAAALQMSIGGRPVDLDTTLSLREVVEVDRATTHDRTLEMLRVRAAAAFTDWLRFDSTTVGSNGGPTITASHSGLYNWHDVFQDVSPAVDFEEAYVDVRLPSTDLRLGKQKVAWGKLDRFQPNDLINPLSYIDPLMQDEADRKIGVPALQGSFYLPERSWLAAESRLTAVWVPAYIPYRVSDARCTLSNGVSRCDVERWFPPAAVPPTAFTIPAGVLGANAVAVPLTFGTQNAALPARNLENSELGLRYSALVRDVDLALYYFHGFDPQPAFRLTADAVGEPQPGAPIPVAHLSGATTLSPVFREIDAGGADFAYAFDQFTFRAEGAFVSGRPFARDLRILIADPSSLSGTLGHAIGLLANGAGRVPVDLPDSFVVRDAVEWGIGADYLYDGYLLLLQLNQTDVLHNHVDLLIKDVETRLLANLRKSFFADRLQTQLVALYGAESDYTMVRPKLLYRITDQLAAEVGYLFISGRAASVVGQYRENDQGWVRLEVKL